MKIFLQQTSKNDCDKRTTNERMRQKISTVFFLSALLASGLIREVSLLIIVAGVMTLVKKCLIHLVTEVVITGAGLRKKENISLGEEKRRRRSNYDVEFNGRRRRQKLLSRGGEFLILTCMRAPCYSSYCSYRKCNASID